MCRPKSAGGRRCPAHSTPEYRAKENARRRAQYATKKQTGNTFGITVTPNNSMDVFNIGKTYKGVLTRDLINPTIDQFGFDEAFKRNQEFWGTSIYDGKLMDEDENQKRLDISLHKSEAKKHQVAEHHKKALQAYTSTKCHLIQKFLLGAKPEDILHRESSPYQPKDPNNLTVEEATNLFMSNKLYTTQGYNAIIKPLDHLVETLTDNQQKILYRAIPGDNALLPRELMKEIRDAARSNNNSHEDTEKIISKHIQIGQEVVFPTFLSTSYASPVAGNLGNGYRIMAEILTPAGAHIEAFSEFPKEHEVLLPRGSRFKIVGFRNRNTVYRTEEKIENEVFYIQMVAINSKGEILDGTNYDPLPPLPGENQ